MNQEYTARFLDKVRPTSPEPDPAGGNRATLLGVYDAVGRGDFEALGAFLTEDVEFDIRGFGPMDGNWRGREPVIKAVRANFGLLADQKPEMESMIAQGDSIAVLFRESGMFKPDGRGYGVRVVQWLTFAGGKIAKIDEIAAIKL
jgi:hypothetical protein